MKWLWAFCEPFSTCGLAEPFSRGGFTYATDGVICVRVPRIYEILEKKTVAPEIEGAFRLYPLAGECSQLAPVLPKREFEQCPEGVQFGGCNSICPECRGVGRVPVVFPVEIGEAFFSSEYLRKMKMFLPEPLRLNSPSGEQPLKFTFRDGCGMLAAMQP